jgi:2-deoxy-D-gluconate 3-dehydrogenase
MAVRTDVSNEESVAAMVSAAEARFGGIDGRVNNAAIDPKFDKTKRENLTAAFESYPLDRWNREVAVNLTGMFLCAKAVAPVMLKRGRGVIVNVSSTYGLVSPDQRLYEKDDPAQPREFKPVTYTVTKAAVLGLTRYLATYWGTSGIRVNTLTPGGVMNEQPDEFVRRYTARTPMARMADRTEFAGPLLFLLSDASSYMTGANLVVDGGWTAW